MFIASGINKLCPITYSEDESCDINFYIFYTDNGDEQRTLNNIAIDRKLGNYNISNFLLQILVI